MAIRIQRSRLRVAPDEPIAATPIAERRAGRSRRLRTGTPESGGHPQGVVSLPAMYRSPLADVIDRVAWEMQPTRPGDYLHVSDLLSKCIRKRAVIEALGVTPSARRLSMSDLVTFAQGDAIHDLLKDRARMGAPNLVWGKWSCKCKALFHEEPCTYGEIDQEEECPHCHTKVDQYHEVSMRDEDLWVVGNPDLVLYYKNIDAYHVTELKSIADKQYQELTAPKPEHILQVVFYWYLMRKLGYRMTDKVSILYVTKGWMFSGKPYKEFVIDPQAELHRLDDMIEDARAHKASILSIRERNASAARRIPTITLPPRTMCLKSTTKTAKSCEVCGECFEMP